MYAPAGSGVRFLHQIVTIRPYARGHESTRPPACHATHISIEEAGLHLTAAGRLLPADRAALCRGMAARRTRRYRFQ
jgi:hypothetical protein